MSAALGNFPIPGALDVSTWRTRCAALHVGGGAAVRADVVPPQDALCRLMREGYFIADGLQLAESLPAMLEAVRGFVRDGLPPVFAFVYDEFWAPFARLQQVVAASLGGDFRALPAFWLWHVDPAKAQRGWKPHRDRDHRALLPDGSPKSVTVWIPLTAVTPSNGCIHIVPADRDPLYAGPFDRLPKFDPAASRALPVEPGQFICWNQAVLHWGGEATDPTAPPRISMALEFQRSDQPVMDQPLLDLSAALSLPERLRLVAKQIAGYEHMEQVAPALLSAAKKIVR